MKILLILFLLFIRLMTSAQTLQLHYDLRHTFDPGQNAYNFPTLYFEYFKGLDTIKKNPVLGPFLLKTQADFTGQQSNVGQIYFQVFQQFKFWKPNWFLNLQYSGGLGVTNQREFSYYIENTYSLGLNYPYKLAGAYVSSEVDFKYVNFTKHSLDISFSFYFWKGLFNYKVELSGDFSLFTQSKNHGDPLTQGMNGKRILFFAEPQIFYNINKKFAIGSKVNTYYHIITPNNLFKSYPTIAIKWKIN